MRAFSHSSFFFNDSGSKERAAADVQILRWMTA
jgi:hypothetical protein